MDIKEFFIDKIALPFCLLISIDWLFGTNVSGVRGDHFTVHVIAGILAFNVIFHSLVLVFSEISGNCKFAMISGEYQARLALAMVEESQKEKQDS